MRISTGSKSRLDVSLVCFLAVLSVCIDRANATDLSGTYSAPQVITEDSRLTGDVECAPTLIKSSCIVFGASHIKLDLNGFTLTGPVDPRTNVAECNKGTAPFGVGIEAADQDDITIEGPGVIQHFERWGIFIHSNNPQRYVTHERVKNVTVTYNCWSGLQTNLVSNSRFERNVWANNAIGSNGAACGGLCASNTNRSSFRRSTYYGNGSLDYEGPPPLSTNGNVDFGLGFEGSSSDNVVEENDIGGNTNGVMFFNTSSNNLIRRNIIAGNPAAQVVKTFILPNQQGADITFRPNWTGANNVFENNYCLTYLRGSGPATAPCPNITTHGVEEAANQPGIYSHPNGNKPSDGADFFSIATLLLATAVKKLVVS